MSSSIDMAKNSIRPRAHPVELALLVVAAGAVAFRLWTSFCFFPLAEWNNVRLAPTFMLAFGSTPYPGLAGGPVTTWIYGPVPLLLNLPAIWAHDTVGALFTAEVINLLLTIVPAAWAVLAVASAEKGASRADGAWAVLFCLALWPNTSLQYLQSDNAAVAFGLIANVLLLRARDGRGSRLAFAGLCTGLAIWSKQVPSA